MSVSRMEVVEVGRRRRWSDAEKLRIVEEASRPGVSVRSVARQHQVSPSQIYDWRKMFLEAATGGAGFAAVIVPPNDQAGPWRGRMEVRCGNGRTMALLHKASGDSLRESRCVDGADAQASRTEVPHDELERI